MFKKNIDNLHFLPNNILTKIFKEFKKKKKDYQLYLNYIGNNYTMCFNVYILSIFMYMHRVTS